MATPFTSVQRANIRLFLGWSARFHQVDSGLEQAMSAIDSETDDATHDIIVGLLTSLASIQTRITDSYGRIKAMKVGAIDLPGALELSLLRSEGRRFAGQLASILSVTVRHDVFTGAGPHRSNVMLHG